MSGCTTTYFNFPGRGFPIRVCLFNAFGKDGFTDERLDFKDWPARKGSTPLGQLPILTLKDGKQVTQTDAIVRWAASQGESPLYPAGEFDTCLQIDEFINICGDVLSKCPQDKDDEAKKAARQVYCAKPDGPMYKMCALLEERLGDNKFVTGDSLTTADLFWFSLSDMIASGQFDHVATTYVEDHFPKLAAHKETFLAHDVIVKFLEHFPNK